METNFQSKGTLLGVEQTETGTYESVVRPDGNVFGGGQGVIMGKGGELATWVGHGVGAIKEDGAVSYRGAVYYQSSSPAWVRLNSVAAIFEYEVDAQGNTQAQLWEWKGRQPRCLSPETPPNSGCTRRLRGHNVQPRVSRGR